MLDIMVKTQSFFDKNGKEYCLFPFVLILEMFLTFYTTAIWDVIRHRTASFWYLYAS